MGQSTPQQSIPQEELSKVAHSALFCLPFSSMILAQGGRGININIPSIHGSSSNINISISAKQMIFFSQPRKENLYR
jgi:hypothetical protein